MTDSVSTTDGRKSQNALECPVQFLDIDGGTYLLDTYAAVNHAVRDTGLFSSDHDVDGTRRQYERDGEMHSFLGAGLPSFPFWFGMIDMDAAEHKPYRQLMTPLLSPKEVQRKEPWVRQLVTECIDSFIETGSFDVMHDLATPVPALVTIGSLGLSPDRAREYSNVMHDMSTGTPGERGAAEVQLGEMLAEVAKVAIDRRTNPKDDWLSILAQAKINGELMSDTVLLANATVIIAGGVETATTSFATTMLHLHRNPADRERLLNDRSLIPSAVEEMLRFYTPVRMQGRTITERVTIGGVDMVEGDRIGLYFAEANRDAAVFDQPDEVRLDRSPNNHISFGAGIHRCVGAALGRLELNILLEEVLERLPDFTLDESNIVKVENPAIHGFAQMPGTFTPGRRSDA